MRHQFWRRLLIAGTTITTVLALTLTSPANAAPGDPVAPTDEWTQSTDDDSDPGFFDISGRASKALDDWFAGLITTAINPVLDLLAQTLLSAPDVTQHNEVREIWLINVAIANSLFALLAIGGGIVVMTHESVQTRYSIKEVLPRLVFAVIATNASLIICGQAIMLANALARAVLGEGIDPQTATGGLGRVLTVAASAGGFVVLLALFGQIMAYILAGTFIVRAISVVLLTIAAPIALACHAMPQTEGLATLWWRSMLACLGVQVAQSLVFIAAIRIFFTSANSGVLGMDVTDGLISLLVVLSLLWIMLKIPTWAGRMVFGPKGGPIKEAKHRVYVTVKAIAKTAAVAAA